LNFAEIAEHFAHAVSHEQVRIVVTTEERTYSKETALQQGLRACIKTNSLIYMTMDPASSRLLAD